MDWQLAAPTFIELILSGFIIVLAVAVSILYSHVKQLRTALSDSEQNSASAIARAEALAKNANNQQTEAQARTLVITRHLQELDEKQIGIEDSSDKLQYLYCVYNWRYVNIFTSRRLNVFLSGGKNVSYFAYAPSLTFQLQREECHRLQ